MNSVKKILGIILLFFMFIISFSGCEQGKKSYTITFKQSGEEDIVFTVQAGESFYDVPDVIQKEGYLLVWDRTEFSDINENIIVNAIVKERYFEVMFSAGNLSNDKYLEIDYTKLLTKENEIINLPVISCYGYNFLYWEKDGKKYEKISFTVDSNAEFIAVWEKDYNSDRWWLDQNF